MPNFLTGKAQPFITATAHDPGLTDEQRQYLEVMGVKALLAAPMILGDEHIGTFTVRLEAERSLPEEDLELIQALANQATLAVQLTRLAEEAKHSAILEERNRLAGEIHDTLAQAFTGISLHLDIAKHLLHEDLSEAETTLDHIGNLAKTGLAEARRSVWALHPDNAEYANLVQKLTHCLEQMTNGTSIHSEITIHGTPYPLPPFIGKNLLRIGQEAITNAIRHAQATHLWVELNYEPGYVDLLVRDNGCGFSLEADTGGFGLFSLSQRVKRIGGQLNFRTQPGDGTEVLVQVAVRQ